MAIFNLRRREIQAKIVYYGPGLSGKTTNLQYIHSKLKPDHKGELMTLATQTDRTLFFDFLPIELGEIRGLKTRFQLYTVPGQVFYNSTRKLVLKNADGVVFVADSRTEALNDNLESLRNLQQNLEAHKLDIEHTPVVFQYNKRDMPTAMSIDELDSFLNSWGVPVVEAQAHTGEGVLDTLSAICKAVIKDLREKEPQGFRQQDPSATLTDSTVTEEPSAPQPPQPPQSPVGSSAAQRNDPQTLATTLVTGEVHGPVTGGALAGGVALSQQPGAAAGNWRLVDSAGRPEWVGDQVRIPITLTNGTNTVKLKLSLKVDLD